MGRAPESQVRTRLLAGGNRIRTIGPPWTHRSLQLSLDCVRAAARPTHRACDLDRRVRSLRRQDFLEVLHEADCILDCPPGRAGPLSVMARGLDNSSAARQWVWDRLSAEGLARFPFPPHRPCFPRAIGERLLAQ